MLRIPELFVDLASLGSAKLGLLANIGPKARIRAIDPHSNAKIRTNTVWTFEKVEKLQARHIRRWECIYSVRTLFSPWDNRYRGYQMTSFPLTTIFKLSDLYQSSQFPSDLILRTATVALSHPTFSLAGASHPACKSDGMDLNPAVHGMLRF